MRKRVIYVLMILALILGMSITAQVDDALPGGGGPAETPQKTFTVVVQGKNMKPVCTGSRMTSGWDGSIKTIELSYCVSTTGRWGGQVVASYDRKSKTFGVNRAITIANPKQTFNLTMDWPAGSTYNNDCKLKVTVKYMVRDAIYTDIMNCRGQLVYLSWYGPYTRQKSFGGGTSFYLEISK